MSQATNVVGGILADPYPSPPAYPSPRRKKDRVVTETKNAQITANARINSEADSRLVEEKNSVRETATRPVTPNQGEVSETKAAEDSDTLLELDAWKTLLNLNTRMCGAATKYSGDPCKNKVSEARAIRIDEIVQQLWQPSNTADQTETHLDELARNSLCYLHDHPPLCYQRVSEWMKILPRERRTPTPQRRLRQILAMAPQTCTSIKGDGQGCRQKLSIDRREKCDKSIERMIQMATAPRDDDDTFRELVGVLRYYLVCKSHVDSKRYKLQNAWETTINEFDTACRNELLATATTLPPSLQPRRKKRHPLHFWDGGFDMSVFEILGKGDRPDKTVEAIAITPLDTSEKVVENEVNSGFVYAFAVAGNPGRIKIGFTTKTAEQRQNEWEVDCNREPVQLYPTDEAAAKGMMPHAHRVERLVHAELRPLRLRFYCRRCRCQHVEWFEISKEEAIAVIEKWERWIRRRPYTGAEWKLAESEAVKLDDIPRFMESLKDISTPEEQNENESGEGKGSGKDDTREKDGEDESNEKTGRQGKYRTREKDKGNNSKKTKAR